MAERDLVGQDTTDHLILHNIAEDLKVPLTRILAHSQVSELGQAIDAKYVAVTADSAIRLIDSYLTSTQIYNHQQQLALEPISISAVMVDVSQQLSRYARQQNKEIKVVSGRKIGLVMANARALHAALTTLSYSLLQSSHGQHSQITLRAERRRNRVYCGVFDSDGQLNTETLQTIRRLRGKATRLSAQLAHGSSSGIVIADNVFGAMGSKLTVTTSKYGSGLVAEFLPSTQLALL